MSNRRMLVNEPKDDGAQIVAEHRGNAVVAPAAGMSGSVGAGPNGVSFGATESRSILCPYCGHIQTKSEQCERCRGLFEPLSRQATQNVMGPWQVRDEKNPFQPGCSLSKLKELIARGKVNRATIVRGPTTKQFWSIACNTPGVAVLLGECHNCHGSVKPDAYMCQTCGCVLNCTDDRQFLGVGPVVLLPGEAHPAVVASSVARPVQRPATPPAPTPASLASPAITIPAVPASARNVPRGAHSAPPASGSHAPISPARRLSMERRARRKAERTRALLGVVIFLIIITITVLGISTISKSGSRKSASDRGSEPSAQQDAPPREP